jgi:hypothetical protein
LEFGRAWRATENGDLRLVVGETLVMVAERDTTIVLLAVEVVRDDVGVQLLVAVGGSAAVSRRQVAANRFCRPVQLGACLAPKTYGLVAPCESPPRRATIDLSGVSAALSGGTIVASGVDDSHSPPRVSPLVDHRLEVLRVGGTVERPALLVGPSVYDVSVNLLLWSSKYLI